jgi:predicted nucleic acid-binding protein
MSFVVDASVAASWFLPDEQSGADERLIAALGVSPGLVPSLFWFETRNLFVMAERRGRLNPGMALAMALKLRTLPLQDGGIGNDVTVVELALKHGLSAYDASYVTLAKTNAMPLATADRKMAAAARSEGIVILGPLEHDH